MTALHTLLHSKNISFEMIILASRSDKPLPLLYWRRIEAISPQSCPGIVGVRIFRKSQRFLAVGKVLAYLEYP
jgi:hypothetical protein